MNIAFLGCSYSNWYDGDCFGESYPALFAKNNPDVNVWDLSIPGSSNDSLYFRLLYAEKHFNIKIDKVVVQLTHFQRTLQWYDWNYDWTVKLFRHGASFDNYVALGEYNPEYFDTITSTICLKDGSDWQNLIAKKLEKITRVPKVYLRMWYLDQFESNKYIFAAQKELDLINGVYGLDNVIPFSWHCNFNSKSKKEHDIILPSNWVGSVDQALGRAFWKKPYAVDNSPHFGAAGQKAVYDWISPNINDRFIRKDK